MKIHFTVLLALNSLFAWSQFSDLSIDFKKAEDIVRDFKSKQFSRPSFNNDNGGSGNNINQNTPDIQPKPYNALSDPGYQPYFGNTPTVQKQVSDIEKEVDKEISKRKNQISKLRGTKEIFKVALERLRSNEDFNTELEDWAKESQAAQIGALITTLNLLGDVAGPIKEVIEVRGFNSVYIYNTLKDRNLTLSKINAILNNYNIEEAKGLKEGVELLSLAMGKDVYLKSLFMDLDNFRDKVTKSAKAIEYLDNVSQKHDLLQAAKYTLDFAVKLIKDELLSHGLKMFQKMAIEKGSIAIAQYTALGKFGVNYLYNSMRFWVSWSNIDDILVRIDNTNSLALSMEIKIQESTDRINSVKRELEQLEAAKGNDEAGKQVLKQIHQQELYDAYLAGDYFGQRTGVYAPGQPILKD